jgi:hypothetical protein
MYQDHLGVRNIEIFETVAGAEMEALGYQLDTTHRRVFTNFDIAYTAHSRCCEERYGEWIRDLKESGSEQGLKPPGK